MVRIWYDLRGDTRRICGQSRTGDSRGSGVGSLSNCTGPRKGSRANKARAECTCSRALAELRDLDGILDAGMRVLRESETSLRQEERADGAEAE